jgi:hypothetical protein
MIRHKTFFGLALLCLLSLSACETMSTHSDYDRTQSFAGYRTFAWIAADPMIVAPGHPRDEVSPLNRRRVVEAIESDLAAKGMTQAAEAASADFVIAYTIGARDKINVNSYPEPYQGAWHWGYPNYWSGVDLNTYTEGRLAIDIFDGRTREPVWHGVATKRIEASDLRHAEERIQTAVKSILKDFPPKAG